MDGIGDSAHPGGRLGHGLPRRTDRAAERRPVRYPPAARTSPRGPPSIAGASRRASCYERFRVRRSGRPRPNRCS